MIHKSSRRTVGPAWRPGMRPPAGFHSPPAECLFLFFFLRLPVLEDKSYGHTGRTD